MPAGRFGLRNAVTVVVTEIASGASGVGCARLQVGLSAKRPERGNSEMPSGAVAADAKKSAWTIRVGVAASDLTRSAWAKTRNGAVSVRDH